MSILSPYRSPAAPSPPTTAAATSGGASNEPSVVQKPRPMANSMDTAS